MGHPVAQHLTPAHAPLARPAWVARRHQCHIAHRKSQIVNGAAFTLIELMVVIVLIGIMTAVILPEMKGTYEDALLRSVSREVVSACGLASSHAISQNQACRLRLDPVTGRYAIQQRLGGEGPEAHFETAREMPGGEGQLDTRIALQIHKLGEEPASAGAQEAAPPPPPDGAAPPGPADDGITFYPDGTADPSEIVLRDRDGFRMALRVNPVTARVRVIELARE